MSKEYCKKIGTFFIVQILLLYGISYAAEDIVKKSYLSPPLKIEALRMSDLFAHNFINIVAHRGNQVAPENTLAAFEKAIEVGADEIELDIRRSRDGIIVVVHDSSLTRITQGKDERFVSDVSFEEMRQYDIGNKNFPEQKIPTLEEVIDLVRGRVKLNIEIKQVPEKDNGIINQLLALIERKGIAEDVLITTFEETIHYLEEIQGLKTGLLINKKNSDVNYYMNMAKEREISTLIFHIDTLSRGISNRVKANGFFLGAWGILTDETKITKAIRLGVNRVIVDNPEVGRRLLIKSYVESAI